MLPDVIPERIRSRIVVTDSGCWTWTGPTSGRGRGGGYGRVSWGGITMSVHRLVWWLTGGRTLRAGEQLDHQCVNRLCCRPDHLRPCFQSSNIRLAHKRRKATTEKLQLGIAA